MVAGSGKTAIAAEMHFAAFTGKAAMRIACAGAQRYRAAGALSLPERRFPQPRSVEELEGCYSARRADSQAIANIATYRSCYGNKTLSRQIEMNAVKRRLRERTKKVRAGAKPAPSRNNR